MNKTKMLLVAATIVFGGLAEAKTIRATELGSSMWVNFQSGKLGDVVVEFRQGDELPLSITAEGDLMETTQSGISYVGIKRNFWLRMSSNNVELSLDGVTYKNFGDLLRGSLEAGAVSNNSGTANSINVVFKAFIK